jgi:hypothetical protein
VQSVARASRGLFGVDPERENGVQLVRDRWACLGRHCVVHRVPATLLAALADLMKWLDATNMPSMVIGGVAASVLGQPRLTQDVDALAIATVRQWVSEFATAMSTSDMLDDFDKLIARSKSAP